MIPDEPSSEPAGDVDADDVDAAQVLAAVLTRRADEVIAWVDEHLPETPDWQKDVMRRIIECKPLFRSVGRKGWS